VWRPGKYFEGPYVAVYGDGGGKASLSEARVAMGIEWMTTLKDLAEAIPPTYTEYIGTEWFRTITPSKG
jgi:DNA (cytosine-5)-methyltransferase 1